MRKAPQLPAATAADVLLVQQLFALLHPVLDERTERLFLAGLAIALGRGGGRIVGDATGVRSKWIGQGKRDLEELREASAPARRQRTRRPAPR
jgi:hypothetical protein